LRYGVIGNTYNTPTFVEALLLSNFVCNRAYDFLLKGNRFMKKLIFVLLMLLALTGCGGSNNNNTVNISSAKSLSDLKGAKIAAQAGTFHADALNQIENVQGSTLPDFTDLLIALQSKTIDGYIAEEPTAISVCKQNENLTYLPLVNNSTGFTATDADTGVAVGLKKGSTLTSQINEILKDVTPEVQSKLMEQIIAVNNGETIDSFVLKSEEPTSPKGTLKVAMECAYEPYNWTNPDGSSFGAVPISGQGKEGLYANGYDVQIAKYIANKLGYKLEIYSYEWDSLIPAVDSGNVDAIIAGMSPTEERAKQIDFTDCYYNSNLVIIINK